MADRAVPPNIQSELTAIMEAVYGEQVRGSIHDALAKMNTQLSNAILNQLIQVDNTLALTGYGADAKKVGDLFADTLVMKGDLDSNTDLNTITVTGIYRLLPSRITSFGNSWIPKSEGEYIDDQYVPGQPMSNSTGFLIVIKNATVVHQKIFYLNSSSSFIQRNAIRICRDLSASPVVWSDWVENVDPTLSVFGNAADAKMVGNRFADDEDAIEKHRLSSLMLNKNYRSAIYTGENLDTRTTSGSFTVTSDTNIANAPVNSKGVLYVFDLGNTNVKMQLFFEDNGTYYIRTKSGSSWSDWKKGSSGAGESIASPFSTSASYAVGDYVTYKDKLWKCKTATTGAWNASKWDEAIVMDEISDAVSNLNDNIQSALNGCFVLNLMLGTLNNEGIPEYSASRVRSDYIDVGDNLHIIVDSAASSTINRFYDANKSPLGDPFTFTVGETVIDVPNGAKYFIVTVPRNNADGLTVKSDVSYLINELEEEDTRIYSEISNTKTDLDLVSNDYAYLSIVTDEYVNVSNNGSFNPYAGWFRTELIEIPKGTEYLLIDIPAATPNSAWYGENGVYIDRLNLTGSGLKRTKIPTQAKYFAISNEIQYAHQYKLYGDVKFNNLFQFLLNDYVINSSQQVEFYSNGRPKKITHKVNNETVRIDEIMYESNSIIEYRTDSKTGIYITITSNLSTLETEVV